MNFIIVLKVFYLKSFNYGIYNYHYCLIPLHSSPLGSLYSLLSQNDCSVIVLIFTKKDRLFHYESTT